MKGDGTLKKMINIGLNNFIPIDKVVAIINIDSAPIRRMVSEAKDKGTLINACYGRLSSSVILTTSDYIILSYIDRKTLAKRVEEHE